MKVLWLTNIMPAVVSEEIGVEVNSAGGWITGLYNAMKTKNIEYIFCFPQKNKVIYGSNNKFTYYGFKTIRNDYIMYSKNIEKFFYEVLIKENPEIVHIFGTEYPYALSMVNACIKYNIQNRILINIQGLVSICEKHFYAGLSNKVTKAFTFKELVRKNNIKGQRKEFQKRGKYEILAIRKSYNIVGRTDWDLACVKQINSQCRYFHCNEILRNKFYENRWSFEKCNKETIFVSQGSYPIKGLHKMLEAFKIVLRDYPNAKLKIAGNNILETSKKITTKNSYAQYLKKLITEYKLEQNIIFLGILTEEQMCKEYLSTHVFVSPSSIENSSNSISEALLLGTPIVASDVGGTNCLIKHKESGFLYPFDEEYMLAYYIMEIFKQKHEITTLSDYAWIEGKKMFDSEKNASRMMDIYLAIMSNR